MNLAMKIILGVLVIAAVFLGYKIYEKKASLIEVEEPALTEASPESQLDEEESSVKTEQMNAEESAVLRGYLQEDASEETKQAYSALVNKYAVAATTLDISKCDSNPFVTAIKQGDKLTVENKDTEPVTMRFDSTYTYTIEPNSTRVLLADFGRGPGSYGYSCPNKAGISGIISIR